MALSECEQRLLDEMERNFHRSDAEVAAADRDRVDYTAVTVGALIVVAGISLAVVGVASQLWWLGIVGFVIMFAGALVMLRRKASGDASTMTPSGRDARGGPEFMSAFERRWDRRQERHGDSD